LELAARLRRRFGGAAGGARRRGSDPHASLEVPVFVFNLDRWGLGFGLRVCLFECRNPKLCGRLPGRANAPPNCVQDGTSTRPKPSGP
jgi:hypothetical protein